MGFNFFPNKRLRDITVRRIFYLFSARSTDVSQSVFRLVIYDFSVVPEMEVSSSNLKKSNELPFDAYHLRVFHLYFAFKCVIFYLLNMYN